MVRWGVVGPGEIASTFAEAMTRVDGGEVVAVASRALDRAEVFADRFGIMKRYGTYEDLAADDDVDAVYIATPQSRHAGDAVLNLEAGKHVLCEKPMALSAGQVQSMVRAARANDRFLMEAMWSRFLPSYRRLVELIDDQRIGEPLQVEADFGFRMRVDPEHRLFDLHRGGGSLLDLGIYPLQLCTLVLGPVVRTSAEATIGSTGVDEQLAALLRHEGGGIGVIKSAIRVPLACAARISGSRGSIDLPALMHCTTSMTVSSFGSEPEVIDCRFHGNGFEFQIDEVHRLLAEGAMESPTMPLSESLALASTMDDIRAQIGLRYPGVDT